MGPNEFLFTVPNSPVGANEDSPCTCTWYRDADFQVNSSIHMFCIRECGSYEMTTLSIRLEDKERAFSPSRVKMLSMNTITADFTTVHSNTIANIQHLLFPDARLSFFF